MQYIIYSFKYKLCLRKNGVNKFEVSGIFLIPFRRIISGAVNGGQKPNW